MGVRGCIGDRIPDSNGRNVFRMSHYSHGQPGVPVAEAQALRGGTRK
jgi:hypothetical protein